MSHPPLRLGILGAARIAPLALIRPARDCPGASVCAVAARDRTRAERFARKHDIPGVHDSYRALLADPDIDAVYNPLPNGLHGVWTERALRAGKHVLCEKPFTANAEQARSVSATARETGRVVMEAFHWRYHPLAARVLEILASGELGEIRHVAAQLYAPIVNKRDIRYDLALAGGATMDMGCYTLSIVRTLAGGEPTVRAARAKLLKPGIDRAMEADLEFGDGRTGFVRCSMWSRHILGTSARVEGSRGTLTVINPVLPHFFHRLRVDTNAGWRRERIRGPATYRCQLDAFVAAIRDGALLATGPDFSIANMAAIDAVYEAAGLAPREPTRV